LRILSSAGNTETIPYGADQITHLFKLGDPLVAQEYFGQEIWSYAVATW